MLKFHYEAKKDPVNLIRGSIVAEDVRTAADKLSRMGLFLTHIEEEKDFDAKDPLGFFRNRIREKDLVDFTRQLSDLLDAGLTIVRALEVLQDQTVNPKFKRILADVRQYCVDGHSLSQSLERHPPLFSKVFVSLVRSGETSGSLENVLKRFSEYSEGRLETRLKIQTALAYPILMSVMGCVTITVLMTFVIPKMMDIFQDFERSLPLPTLILIGASRFVTHFGWVLILVLVGSVLALRRFLDTSFGRLAFDRFLLRIPIAGALIQKIEIARFTNTLATLLNNGVSLLESLRVASETIGNLVIRLEIESVYEAVKRGSTLAKGFNENDVFPLAIKNMIAVGEESGRVEKSLFKVAEICDRESDASIKTMVSLLEPALILTIGVVVGFIVVAILLPIFEMSFLG